MSDTLVEDARPRKDFSSPAFHREAFQIQHVFATLAGSGIITKPKLLYALASVPGYTYWSDAPLTDGYVPQAVAYFRCGRGKVGIVFPRCGDTTLADGTVTDRMLTIHYIAEVLPRDAEKLMTDVLQALAEIPPGEPEDAASAPCGYARIA